MVKKAVLIRIVGICLVSRVLFAQTPSNGPYPVPCRIDLNLLNTSCYLQVSTAQYGKPWLQALTAADSNTAEYALAVMIKALKNGGQSIWGKMSAISEQSFLSSQYSLLEKLVSVDSDKLIVICRFDVGEMSVFCFKNTEDLVFPFILIKENARYVQAFSKMTNPVVQILVDMASQLAVNPLYGIAKTVQQTNTKVALTPLLGNSSNNPVFLCFNIENTKSSIKRSDSLVHPAISGDAQKVLDFYLSAYRLLTEKADIMAFSDCFEDSRKHRVIDDFTKMQKEKLFDQYVSGFIAHRQVIKILNLKPFYYIVYRNSSDAPGSQVSFEVVYMPPGSKPEIVKYKRRDPFDDIFASDVVNSVLVK